MLQNSKLSSLITKDSYYTNNPILAEIRDKISNDTFVEFYTKLEQYSKIFIDWLKKYTALYAIPKVKKSPMKYIIYFANLTDPIYR